jgi:hypothetical protein
MTIADQPRSCNGTDALSSDFRIPWFEIPLYDRPTIPLTLPLSPQGRGRRLHGPGFTYDARSYAPLPSRGEGRGEGCLKQAATRCHLTSGFPPLPSRGEEFCRMLCSHPHSQAATDKFVFFTYDAANRSHHSALNVRCSMFTVHCSLFLVYLNC